MPIDLDISKDDSKILSHGSKARDINILSAESLSEGARHANEPCHGGDEKIKANLQINPNTSCMTQFEETAE